MTGAFVTQYVCGMPGVSFEALDSNYCNYCLILHLPHALLFMYC